MSNHLETVPVLIGKYWWRCIVFDYHGGKRYTDFEWKRDEADPWRSMDKFPRYDSNDVNNGCPKSITTKIYYPNLPAIKAALEGTSP